MLGVPDDRFGEAVVALVEGDADPAELDALARQHLAGYKAPKRIIPVESVERAPNGKLDRKRLRERALEAIA